jgi:hypothetical protein
MASGAGIEESVEAARAAKARRLKTSEKLSRTILRLRDSCAVCFISTGQLRACTSPFVSCDGTFRTSMDHEQEWLSFKRNTRFAKFTTCYYCWVPLDRKRNGEEPNAHRPHTQRLLDASKRKKQGGGVGTESQSPCDFADIIPLALYTAFALPSVLKMVEEKFGFSAEDDIDKFRQWVCVEKRDQGEFYKGLEAFLYLCSLRFGY